MNRTMLVFAALIAVVLLAAVLTWPHGDHPDHARPRIVGSPQTASPGPASPPATATTDEVNEVDRLLPFPRAQITQAAWLAERFTAAYTSHRAGETPRQYAQRLAVMTTPTLLPPLEQAAEDPAAPARARRQETVGQARVEAIRTLGPTSIIFVVIATTHTSPPAAAPRTARPTARPPSPDPTQPPGDQHAPAPRQETVRYAITTIHLKGRWLVYAIEPATSGDWGEGGDLP